MDKYELEKIIWTQEDFMQMGWHDSYIHAVSFPRDFRIVFDIDYILKWVIKGKRYKFWVSPCTWVFENVYDLCLGLEISQGIYIDEVTMLNPKTPKNIQHMEKKLEYDWTISTQQGDISFVSVGYMLYVRKAPVFTHKQCLDEMERGAISFELP